MTPDQLRALRTKLNLTQSALAAKLSLTRDAIGSMETGRNKIRPVIVMAIEHLSCKRRK